jgi:3-hydroxyacyl-[acyl-carrier-protein] dehydratase
MPPPLLFDLNQVDSETPCLTRAEIYRRLPHRHEFALLDGALHLDPQAGQIVTFVDVRDDAWWFRGHVPGRPLLPGVLMLEMAAQSSALLAQEITQDKESFIGFGGVGACKFREPVTAPSRLIILCAFKDSRPRRFIAATQGLVGDKLAFEAEITGLRMPSPP